MAPIAFFLCAKTMKISFEVHHLSKQGWQEISNPAIIDHYQLSFCTMTAAAFAIAIHEIHTDTVRSRTMLHTMHHCISWAMV